MEAKAEIPQGSRQLILAVTDGGDGFDSDHADWINPTVTLKDGSLIDLTGEKMLRKSAGWGEVHVNTNLEGGKLKIDGKEYDKGIATHANSIIIFDLPEDAVSFSAIAGLYITGTDQGSKSSVEFLVFNYDPTYRYEWTDQWTGGNVEVKVDPEKQLVTSGYVCRKGKTEPITLEAPVKDAEKLYLVVTNGGDGLSYDHADWVNPMLVKANGEEVSLTDFKWDANPINGWNAPKVNKDNDGNTLNIGGTEYEKGFGVNAPSVLTFTLPENHDFVTLVTLSLTDLGLAEGQKARLTDMWTGETKGEFSDSEFNPFLREHGSGLYRISPLGRIDSASLTLSATEDEEKGAITLTATVAGGEPENAYIQFEQDGKIIGAVKIDDNMAATLTIPAKEGTHTYRAFYSGNSYIANAESTELTITTASVKEAAAETNAFTVIPRKGGVTVKGPLNTTLAIYTASGEVVRYITLNADEVSISLEKGIYLIGNNKYMIE